jgi:membrane protease YdiL (CAAX protease family)
MQTLLNPEIEQRIRRLLTSWGVALGLLLLFFIFHWKSAGRDVQQMLVPLRAMLEKEILAFDAQRLREDEGSLEFPYSIAHVQTPEDFESLILAADHRGLTSGWLDVDCALIFEHFAEVTEDKEWHDKAVARLDRAGDLSVVSYYGIPASRAIHGEELTAEERTAFEKTCRSWPTDWWVVNLARVHKVDGVARPTVFQRRGDAALKDLAGQMLIHLCLYAVGLAFAWWGWKTLSSPDKARSSSDRMFRLWPLKRLVFAFSIVSLVMLALGHLLGAINFWLAYRAFAYTSGVYFWSTVYWLVTAVVITAAPVFLLRRVFGPSWHALRRSLGMTSDDFFIPRLWIIGVGGAASLYLALSLLESVVIGWNLSDPPLDGLSRSADFMGALELPFSLFWGCLMAPFVEEIVFRGFFFHSIRIRWGVTAGMWISSALFALMHVYGLLGTLQVFIYGMVFCWVSWRTKRIAASMILHGCVNAGLVILTHLGR